jgi:hypothetical protein
VRKLFPFAIVALVAWFAYGRYEAQRHRDELAQASAETAAEEEEGQGAVRDTQNLMPERSTVAFNCDGRTHCSQMTSCEEAEYFINHCPGTEMDGDRDGVPCERQWCETRR